MPNRLRLGITTIGDLLLRNKISETTNEPICDIHLKIPVYQRPYKWTVKNVNQLVDDIIGAMADNKEVYRVGTLILHYDENDDSYNIVDGQQRTITFSLILKNLFEGNEQINFLTEVLPVNSDNVSNICDNYRAIDRRIDGFRETREFDFFSDYVANHCELIVVITNDLSEAFQFFDSQNSRGKSLYPHDLLKAYHLREMNHLRSTEIEMIVKMWESLNQEKLSVMFKEYIYRLKEWIKGNRSYELNEHNIDIFKGVTSKDKYPYAQYYKGAFTFADELNRSNIPFVTGLQGVSPFQLNAPIIAGKPFFEYAKYYFDLLADIQNNNRYEGYYLNDNEIVRTLDLSKLKNGIGNRITRLMFDTAILLYIDRFCPIRPSKDDSKYLDEFIIMAFIWAYSMRAQYINVGWAVAQNYILKKDSAYKNVENSFNIFRVIVDSDSPDMLLSRLVELLKPLKKANVAGSTDNLDSKDDAVFSNYLYFFKKYKYLEG